MDNVNDINSYTGVEICVALEDFIYGGKVKVAIPSMHPFMDNTKVSTNKNKINFSNIMNKDKSKFTVSNSKYCESTNYISVLIPEEMYRYRNQCSKKLTYKGLKGEKFAISFLGGSIDNPIIIRRL